jgi:hypothetical protein
LHHNPKRERGRIADAARLRSRFYAWGAVMSSIQACLDRLVDAIPPPAHPVGLKKSWQQLENELHMMLPPDYMKFISLYGSGGFDPQELWIWNFLDELPEFDFIRGQMEYATDAKDDNLTIREFQEHVPILSFGGDGGGRKFFWAQKGLPHEWYVIVVKGGLTFYQFPDLNLTGFLVALLLDREPRVTSLYFRVAAEHEFHPAPNP